MQVGCSCACKKFLLEMLTSYVRSSKELDGQTVCVYCEITSTPLMIAVHFNAHVFGVIFVLNKFFCWFSQEYKYVFVIHLVMNFT